MEKMLEDATVAILAQGSRCESAVCRLLVTLVASLSAGLVNGPQRMVSRSVMADFGQTDFGQF